MFFGPQPMSNLHALNPVLFIYIHGGNNYVVNTSADDNTNKNNYRDYKN